MATDVYRKEFKIDNGWNPALKYTMVLTHHRTSDTFDIQRVNEKGEQTFEWFLGLEEMTALRELIDLIWR